MSTKLNAEELASNRYPSSDSQPGKKYVIQHRRGYFNAIREVAQPLADENAELRDALEAMVREAEFKEKVAGGLGHFEEATNKARAVLAKHNKK